MTSAPPPPTLDAHLARVFREARDRRVAERAVARGWLDAATLAEADLEADETGRSLCDVLRAHGWLDAEKHAVLEEELGRTEFARLSGELPGTTPPEVMAARQDPGRHLGGYVLVTPLGRGGTGEVWKAWDGRLRRWLAVKVASAVSISSTARARFEREALAAGHLSHPHIVPVHHVGVEGGRAYLVMPLIEGVTLATAALTRRQALEVVRTIARAIDHAHRHDLVHRDIKPANIMVDAQGTPFLLDFGVAYLAESGVDTMTRPGDVLGTAGYLSPEQARGGSEARLPATDVYGLGATLFHLMTGRPPFQADSFAATVAQVLTDDVPRARSIDPTIDPRVDRILQRALDKDPRARYPSAAALATDLDLVLEDRPLAFVSRGRLRAFWRRQLRTPRHLIAVGILVLVAGAALVGRASSRRQRLAEEAFRRAAATSLESALRLRRVGDTTGMRRALSQMTAAYDESRAGLADVPEIDYLIGRLHRAQMADDRALALQDRALSHAADFAPALYERAVLQSRRYGALLARALGGRRDVSPTGAADAIAADRALTEEIERRQPALRVLREAVLRDGQRLESLLPAGDVKNRAIAGILAHYRSDHREAIRILNEVVVRDPLMEEAWQTMARAQEAIELLQPAEFSYDQALSHDRGYLPHWVGRCEVRSRLGNQSGAAADATAALAIDPDNVDAFGCRAAARMIEGNGDMTHGKDPRPAWAVAETDYGEALRRDPAGVRALWGRGTLHRYRATYALIAGGTPLPELDAALADLSRGIAVDPAGAQFFSSRGRTHATKARWLAEQGLNPEAELDAAEADYAQAIAITKKLWGAWEWRADARALRARWRMDGGGDVAAAFAAAEEAYKTLATMGNFGTWAFLNRGKMLVWRGRFQARGGADPLPAWNSAEANLLDGMKKDPSVVEGWLRLAALRDERAAYLRAQGRPTGTDVLDAAADRVRARAIDPKASIGRLD